MSSLFPNSCAILYFFPRLSGQLYTTPVLAFSGNLNQPAANDETQVLTVSADSCQYAVGCEEVHHRKQG